MPIESDDCLRLSTVGQAYGCRSASSIPLPAPRSLSKFAAMEHSQPPQLREYLAVLMLFVLAVGATGGMIALSALLGKRGQRSKIKDTAEHPLPKAPQPRWGAFGISRTVLPTATVAAHTLSPRRTAGQDLQCP